jgi:hypothetical protein
MPLTPREVIRRSYEQVQQERFAAFQSGFRRSRRGNLWRIWEGVTLTIFARGGSYRWSIAAGEGQPPRFARVRSATEEAAMADLWQTLNG